MHVETRLNEEERGHRKDRALTQIARPLLGQRSQKPHVPLASTRDLSDPKRHRRVHPKSDPGRPERSKGRVCFPAIRFCLSAILPFSFFLGAAGVESGKLDADFQSRNSR